MTKIYEALRQRVGKGEYARLKFDKEHFDSKYAEWMRK